jgi:hypothetical protein
LANTLLPSLRLTVLVVLLLATGCARGHDAPTVPQLTRAGDTAALNVPDTAVALPIRTYDGSGETVHPDFAAPRAPWRHRLFYLALTPYPSGSATYENPSLYASIDGVRWSGAPRAPMPLVRPVSGHLSDPDIVHASARDELLLYYREASDSDRIFLTSSKDGATWSRPARLFAAPRSAALSPAVVRRRTGEWLMWSVNALEGCLGYATNVELRRSADGIAWSTPQPVDLRAPSLLSAWHIDVQWIPDRDEYWALFPVKAPETCATTALFLATSRDGLSWRTLPNPVLTAGALSELSHIVYRSTFSYDARTDMVTLWVSGARLAGSSFKWRTVAMRRPRRVLFAELSRSTRARVAPPLPAVTAAFTPP